jgi:PKD repeat protein
MSGSPARKVITFGVLIAIIAMLVPFSVSCSKPSPPTADFAFSYVEGELLIADPIAGTAPLTVRFTDQSSGDITSWRWNLGDGTIVQGAGGDARDFTHTYNTPNSSGYTVVLALKWPGGKPVLEEKAVVTVLACSEAANTELSEAKLAIQSLLSAAGGTALDAPVAGWDGSSGKVTAGGIDAASYLRVWKYFKAAYDFDDHGTVVSGTDVSWGCIEWTMSITGPRWRAKSS